MKRYYGLVGFWIGTVTGIIILTLVILEAKKQNKDTIQQCSSSQELQQIQSQLSGLQDLYYNR